MTDAQARIDHLLSRDPLGQGDLLSEDLYRLNIPPLIVTYSVDPDQRKVTIESVRSVP